MTQVKPGSTQNINKEAALLACPVTYVMNRIGGRWKPVILYQLRNGPMRYSELKRSIPAITEKMLIQHLKELQGDSLVIRKAEAVVPPFVTYCLSPSAEELQPVLHALAEWGFRDSRR